MKDVNLLTGNGVDVQKSLELFGDMETYDEALKIFNAAINIKPQKENTTKEKISKNIKCFNNIKLYILKKMVNFQLK